MFSALSDKLDSVFRNLRGLGKISESNVQDAMREIRFSLLEADVELSVVKDFISRVKEKALGEAVVKSITPGQQIVKIFHDELTQLLGGDPAPLDLTPPARLLIVGLNGAGKTTSSAKLALHLTKQGKKPVLIACDLHRPAAIEQLATLAKEINVPMFRPVAGETKVIKVVKEALKWLEETPHDVAIFDTAGRQEVDEELLQELVEVRKLLSPQEVLLVVDSATGQQAVNVAKTFDAAIGISGLVLTKLDGDARGGAALSMRSVTQRPIKFIGVGEKMNQLEAFVPDRLAQRILGMGDIVGLVEAATEAIDEEDAMKMMSRMSKGSFDFEDFLAQMKMMKKLMGGGGMMGLLSMIPGIGKQLKGLPNMNEDGKLKSIEAMILSMTPKERKKPDVLNHRRRQRIANGSGTKLVEVNQFIKQFNQMRSMMNDKGGMKKMMAQMGGGMPGMGGAGMPDLSGLSGLFGGGAGGKGPANLPKLPKMPGGFKLPWQ